MRFRGPAIAILAAAAVAGCGLLAKLPRLRQPPPTPATFSQYHLNGWRWDRVARVVVLPFLNESEYTRSGDEMLAAFTSELQRLGRFEVVAAPGETAMLAAQVHRGGQFDEAVMLDIARITQADVIIHGTITQYSPYPRPRLGLILQAVGPQQAKVVGSVDGLWDTTDGAIAWRVRAFYRQTPRERPPWIRNHVIACDDSFAAEQALDSPALFQRFVSHEAALALLGFPVPGIAVASGGSVNAAGVGGPVGPDGKACGPGGVPNSAPPTTLPPLQPQPPPPAAGSCPLKDE